jgi:hypothetical protein
LSAIGWNHVEGAATAIAQAQNVARASVVGFAAGATTMLARGGRFQATQVVTDAFGNALGESLARGSSLEADQQRSGRDEAAFEKAQWAAYAADPNTVNAFVGAFSGAQGWANGRDTSNDVLLAAGEGFSLGSGNDPDRFRAENLARMQRMLGETPNDAGTSFRVEINGVSTIDEYNAAQVHRAFEKGEDLRPTLANAARLDLVDPNALSEGQRSGMVIAAALAGGDAILSSDMPPDIASGAGGPSMLIAGPTGRAIGAGGMFMHEYKYGALDSIRIDTELAAQRGDTAALWGNAMKGAVIETMLPGSPQELVAAVGGGIAISKGLGLATGAAVNRFPVLGMSVSDAWSETFASSATGRVSATPLRDQMLADSELLTNRPSGVNELPPSATNAGNRLKYVSQDTWESPQGLQYGPDAQYGNRIQHVLRHAEDQPLRVGEHGVFDAGRKGVVQVVDEAWISAQQGGTNVVKTTVGTKDTYLVDMGRRVGWVGGQGGSVMGNPGVNNVLLVVRNGNQVVTAYPIR